MLLVFEIRYMIKKKNENDAFFKFSKWFEIFTRHFHVYKELMDEWVKFSGLFIFAVFVL